MDLGATERDLVAGVVAAPDEDGPRVVYGDWLSDRNDPRGELIVVQCELYRAFQDDRPVPETTALHDRSIELMTKHRESWLAPVLDVAVGNYEFRRGFIERLDVLQPDIDCVRLREVAPLLRAIKTAQATAADLFGYLDVIPLDELALYGITDPMITRQVFEEPRLETLRVLDVRYRGGRPHLSELARLNIPLRRFALHFHRTQPFDEPGVLESLVAHSTRSALRVLDLAHVSLGDLGVLAGLPALETLTLLECACDPRTLRHLALPDLTSLAITDSATAAIEPVDPVALLAAFPALRRLRLSNSRLGDRAALALASSPLAAGLRRLDLSHNQITAVGARALADSEHLRDLVWLDLTVNAPSVNAVRDHVQRSLVNADVRI